MKRRRTWTWPVAAVLLALYWWMAVSVSPRHSPAADEIAHLTAGYAYWTTGDLRLQPENGNLPQRWAALPLLVRHPRFPPTTGEAWRDADVWRVGFDFFYTLGNNLARMLWDGRAMIALFGVALAAMVFVWSRALFGVEGAFLSLLLCVFSPNLLAHGGLITSDMAVTAGFCVATLACWRLAHRVTPARTLVAGAAVGALALAKFSAVLFAPLLVAMVAVRLARAAPLPLRLGAARWRVRGWRRLVILLSAYSVVAALAVALIWAACDFRYAATPRTEAAGLRFNASWSEVLLQHPSPNPEPHPSGQPPADLNPGHLHAGWPQRIVRFARAHHLLPEPYLYGLAYVYRFSGWRPAFLAGHTETTGRWWFFPFAFLIKTPLPVFGLLALAAIALVTDSRRSSVGGAARRRRLYRMSPLFLLVGVYGAFAVSSHLNIGLRHILPLYPALFVLAGAAVLLVHRRPRWVAALVVGLLAWFAAASWWIRPSYLAYFNELIGGPSQGYRYLVDSSLDWGQDLPGLKTWLARHAHPHEPVYLSYFGSGDPVYYGIHATRLGDDYFDLRPRPAMPAMGPGLYCLSATMFQHIYTLARGPWSAADERRYQHLTRWYGRFLQHPDVSKAHDFDGVPLTRREALGRLLTLEQLRFARLCRYLRDRTPDAEVGYSILIFRLTGRDLARALAGPIPSG